MQAPTVIARHEQGDTLRLTLAISEDLDCFEGHFPGQPVLPGVVQLHWAAGFAREQFGLQASPNDIQRLKFKSVGIPPLEVELELTRVGPHDVRFSITGDGRQYSEGRLRYPEAEQ